VRSGCQAHRNLVVLPLELTVAVTKEQIVVMDGQNKLHTLYCDRDKTIATVTLDRPKSLNALNALMFDELERIFFELTCDSTVRVILLTGSGERAFAAGADIRELLHTNSVSGKSVSERGQKVFAQVEHCGKPVIACINGVAFGGGCELALACTLRLASDKALLGFPEVKLGLIPGYGGTQRLARLIGRPAALHMMLSAQSMNATDALRLGLVDEVVPAAHLIKRGRDLAETISTMAPLAISGILEAVARGEERLIGEGLAAETEIFSRLCDTADKQEGLTAFLEKRPAVWQGK
jgi:enoyl-CoA hydratase